MADKVDVTGLDGIMAQLNSLNLSREDKVKAVNAGAEAYIKHLVPKIPIDKSKKKGKHLKDFVTYKPGQYADGSTDVGFTKKGYYYRFVDKGHFLTDSYKYTNKKGRKITSTYAYHSRRPNMKDLNFGTKHISGQHFMEHAAEEAKNDINKAIADTLRSEKR